MQICSLEFLCDNGAMSDFYARASHWIDAPPDALFDIVADPTNHPVIDGSATVAHVMPGAPKRLFLGAEFAMVMHNKFTYRMRNRVTEFVPGRIIAWKPLSGHTWRYTFTPHDGGTLVTEEWDARGVWNRWAMKAIRAGQRNRVAMEQSLQRLQRLVATP